MIGAVAAIAAGMGTIASGGEVVVNVFDFDFSTAPKGETPEDAVVNSGDSVTWVWQAGEIGLHSVKSIVGSTEVYFEPATGDDGHEFTHVFKKVGTHSYYCDVHGVDKGDGTFLGMGGFVTVICKADCNKDGKLNINDFICFQGAWKRREAYGDFDGSGTYTINDFIAFQQAFARGCQF